jgi:hypothetical protein
MKKQIGQYLYACGDNQIPAEIKVDGHQYFLKEILKHDFFAATALYITKPKRLSEQSHPETRPATTLFRYTPSMAWTDAS